MPHWRKGNAGRVDWILLRALQPSAWRRSSSTALSASNTRWGPAIHPTRGSWGGSQGAETRKISRDRQHTCWNGASRRRDNDHHPNRNLQQHLAYRNMANILDPVDDHHAANERKSSVVQKLPRHQLDHSPKQSDAKDGYKQTETSRRDHHRWSTSRFQSREEHYRADV